MSITKPEELVICGLTPYFLEKPDLWFKEHGDKISPAAKTNHFFRDNVLLCQINQRYRLSEFLRKLDELGYEKALSAAEPGEFSKRGGIIDIFPINLSSAVRLEFEGNYIENMEPLPGVLQEGAEARKRLLRRLKRQKIYSELGQLKRGDYLVHLDHGIGVYAGNCQMERTEGGPGQYYILEYAQGDKLYVPVGLERKLSRYVGFSEPKISRLSSPLWHKIKRRIKEETEKLAKELLGLYALREVAERKPYISDGAVLRGVIASFPFGDTPDQTEAFEDIKKDVSDPQPMDRLVCGDVGFGKTEIALRTAVMAAESGLQTAFLCPTTILAHQHYRTFTDRLYNAPIKIGLLSRLQSNKEQRETLMGLAAGKIDIAIGTHRLLAKDVSFKNCGLLIIDDEQRFGVKQKERLKKLKSSLDVLSLSATPIPRTLYLSLSSLKKISIIQTPPPARLPVKTLILPFREKKIKAIINSEIRRHGQIYYLHNKIETIDHVKNMLAKLAPRAAIGVAHGRLPEHELIKAMENFREGKIDILLATTIIENGLDLENANTLIVEDATRLGLAQAHQIRGRVGRSHKQAFAYFLYPEKLSGLAKERLMALKEMQDLGSGWRIAQKDLEIRGAGNILGKEQSGNVNRVGLNLYCQMLSDAVERLRTARSSPQQIFRQRRICLGRKNLTLDYSPEK